MVTGQLADTPTRGLDDSRTGHLADWSTRGLDNSRAGQLADVTCDFACIVFVLLAASARPRVVQSASWQSASWRIRELSSYRQDARNGRNQSVSLLAVPSDCKKVKVKAFPYSIPSVGPGADPGVQAVSPQVTVHPAVGCHYFPPGLRLPPQPQSITALWPVPSYTAW